MSMLVLHCDKFWDYRYLSTKLNLYKLGNLLYARASNPTALNETEYYPNLSRWEYCPKSLLARSQAYSRCSERLF